MGKFWVYLSPSTYLAGYSGSEEFFYLLRGALVQYGSLIVHGMYQHTFNKLNKIVIKGDSKNTDADEASTSEKPIAEKERQPFVPGHERHPVEREETEKEFPAATETKDDEMRPPRSGCHSGPQRRPNILNVDSKDGRSSKRDKTNSAWNMRDPGESKMKKKKKDLKEEDKIDEDEKALMEAIRGMKLDLSGDDGDGDGNSNNSHDSASNSMSIYKMSEIAGLGDVKEALEEFACFFLHFPHLTRQLKQRSSTGILLFGPQGTGKTLLVRSFAKQYNLALYDIRASAVLSKYVGEAEKFVRALFRQVRRDAPAVLLLDECDGLLARPSHRSSDGSGLQLLQNELKNQWSDLIYAREEVLVVGATNKPHDIDLDGFGRRLSLKLHVDLPAAAACQQVLQSALSKMRHCLSEEEDELETLGHLCAERHLSGYDIHCLVEGQLRRALRGITRATHFKKSTWQGKPTRVPCKPDDEGAVEGSWRTLAARSPVAGLALGGKEAEQEEMAELSYVPFTFADIHAAILAAQPTVDEAMRQKHMAFAALHSPRPPGAEDD
ncbi:hypothetical protein SBRCBS47491_010092 [Sporothrix bragantina]|uniref:AAA+ ATPase domain-containing protein n=1 Tax=Sporothrix bragantina TaxID=671064 RepID=A0ABP0D2J7_9PEZI